MGGNNIQRFDVYLITKVNICSEGEGSKSAKGEFWEQIQFVVSSNIQLHMH